jgi:tetratricopeptide (TPR) repeat protein
MRHGSVFSMHDNKPKYTLRERIAMHIRLVRFGLLLLMCCLYCFCQKDEKSKEILIKIGGAPVSRLDYEMFQQTKNMYPTPVGDFFKGPQSDMTTLVNVELLYNKAKSGPAASQQKSSSDWKWKEKYFPAQLYLQQVLVANFGFSDKEIEAYYDAHRETFKSAAKPDTAAKDSSGKKLQAKEVVTYEPLAQVKQKIIFAMFLAKYPVPDSLLRKNPKDTANVDTAKAKNGWFSSVQRSPQDFFMKMFYKERFKENFPDSIGNWYGEKKVITPEDMKVIMSWLPEGQSKYYTNPQGTRQLAEWLLRWKLFSEKAKETGFSGSEQIKEVLEWAWKLNVVANYVENDLMPAAKASAPIDTSMCTYAYWDEKDNPSAPPDSSGLASVINQYSQRAARMKIDAQLYNMRKEKGIEVVAKEFNDDLSGNPAALSAHADSLRDTGNTQEAQNCYWKLLTTFSFTPEGMRAYTEDAKILTEKQMYSQAIKYYRDYLVLSDDKSKRCNTFFMIGFIYDEYQNKSDLAEINYRWVLKNTPECELAEDAEFMDLHLGEPMSSVEELRAEALRQGKKVDTTSIPESTQEGVKKHK